jgi:hypothetical protein
VSFSSPGSGAFAAATTGTDGPLLAYDFLRPDPYRGGICSPPGSWQLSSVSVLQCVLVTAFINEITFKPAMCAALLDTPARQMSATIDEHGDGARGVPRLRDGLLLVSPRNLLMLIALGVPLITRPAQNYLSWRLNAVNFVPEIVVVAF